MAPQELRVVGPPAEGAMHTPSNPRQSNHADADASTPSGPPGAYPPARRLVRRALAPVERFLAIEAASGIVLMFAALVALVWANSPWREAYVNLWHTPLGVRIGSFAFERDLHFWINDGLMTVFFFVVGLEIRRELHGGELSDVRRAALPIAAAVGGMIAPALIYYAFNHGRESVRGWGIPMATDIAFAVGALMLLGRRVAPAQRVLLLALAVIDDVGAILVIALFYSVGVEPVGLLVAAAGVAGILAMQGIGVRSPWAYVVPAVVVWGGAYASGVHPTLAGVVVGLLTPSRAWLGTEGFLRRIGDSLEAIRAGKPVDRSILPHLNALDDARREAVSPAERTQHALHGYVAFGIMPLFALANAGVPIGAVSFEGDGLALFAGILVGLVVGKPVGIVLLSRLLVRLGLSSLPAGVGWRRVGVIGAAGGIGFTMALFIAQLAFAQGALLEVAKVAILVASVTAAVASLLAGRFLTEKPTEEAASTEAEAEASTAR